jgi:hypothetical protein
MGADTLLSAFRELVAAVGECPENGRGTEQGITLNRAYTRACAALEAGGDVIEQAVRRERGICQELAARYGGSDAEEIAELIGSRNFSK